MAVIIKNLQIPKNCLECRIDCDEFLRITDNPEYYKERDIMRKTRPDWCPIIGYVEDEK